MNLVSSESQYIEYPVSPEMYALAKRMSDEQGSLKNSIIHGESNIYGYIGEEIFWKLYPAATRVNNTSYDFIYNGITVDVKSKHCAFRPKLHYECSVALVTQLQKTDIYYFCRVRKDCKVGWALGWMPSDLYKTDAELKHEGEYNPSNKMTFRCDCLNMYIHDL